MPDDEAHRSPADRAAGGGALPPGQSRTLCDVGSGGGSPAIPLSWPCRTLRSYGRSPRPEVGVPPRGRRALGLDARRGRDGRFEELAARARSARGEQTCHFGPCGSRPERDDASGVSAAGGPALLVSRAAHGTSESTGSVRYACNAMYPLPNRRIGVGSCFGRSQWQALGEHVFHVEHRLLTGRHG